MISLPVVVIVHGSQDNNALATIIWDCAFSESVSVKCVIYLYCFYVPSLYSRLISPWYQCKWLWVFSPCQPFCYCHQDRVPFMVPDRVPWRMMYSTLNSKFTSEVQTNHNLDHYNQHFLAQKIFDKPDFADDFSNMLVSWGQFNKVNAGVCPLAQTYRLTHTDISWCSFNLTGGAPGPNIHLLAVVWRSDGPEQEAPKDLLERRVMTRPLLFRYLDIR